MNSLSPCTGTAGDAAGAPQFCTNDQTGHGQRQEVPSVVTVGVARCAGLCSGGLRGAQHPLTPLKGGFGGRGEVQLHSSCGLQWFLQEELGEICQQSWCHLGSCSGCKRGWAAIAGCFFRGLKSRELNRVVGRDRIMKVFSLRQPLISKEERNSGMFLSGRCCWLVVAAQTWWLWELCSPAEGLNLGPHQGHATSGAGQGPKAPVQVSRWVLGAFGVQCQVPVPCHWCHGCHTPQLCRATAGVARLESEFFSEKISF